MFENGVFMQNLKLIILFGQWQELSHWLAKSLSVPFFAELMRLFGETYIANFFKHSAPLQHSVSRKNSLRHVLFCLFFFFFIFVEEVWSQSSKWYQTWDDQLLYGVRWEVILYRKSMGSLLVAWYLLVMAACCSIYKQKFPDPTPSKWLGLMKLYFGQWYW